MEQVSTADPLGDLAYLAVAQERKLVATQREPRPAVVQLPPLTVGWSVYPVNFHRFVCPASVWAPCNRGQ